MSLVTLIASCRLVALSIRTGCDPTATTFSTDAFAPVKARRAGVQERGQMIRHEPWVTIRLARTARRIGRIGNIVRIAGTPAPPLASPHSRGWAGQACSARRIGRTLEPTHPGRCGDVRLARICGPRHVIDRAGARIGIRSPTGAKARGGSRTHRATDAGETRRAFAGRIARWRLRSAGSGPNHALDAGQSRRHRLPPKAGAICRPRGRAGRVQDAGEPRASEITDAIGGGTRIDPHDARAVRIPRPHQRIVRALPGEEVVTLWQDTDPQVPGIAIYETTSAGHLVRITRRTRAVGTDSTRATIRRCCPDRTFARARTLQRHGPIVPPIERRRPARGGERRRILQSERDADDIVRADGTARPVGTCRPQEKVPPRCAIGRTRPIRTTVHAGRGRGL